MNNYVTINCKNDFLLVWEHSGLYNCIQKLEILKFPEVDFLDGLAFFNLEVNEWIVE